MSQERQKLSFFIVVMFLAVFGIIILAEVLSMDEGKHGGYGVSYDHDAREVRGGQSAVDKNIWETPKPLLQPNSNKPGMVKLQTHLLCSRFHILFML